MNIYMTTVTLERRLMAGEIRKIRTRAKTYFGHQPTELVIRHLGEHTEIVATRVAANLYEYSRMGWSVGRFVEVTLGVPVPAVKITTEPVADDGS